jgi:hypothetical protein
VPAAILLHVLAMLRDLVHHKKYANVALLNAIAENERASADSELQYLLHQIILANRFWLASQSRLLQRFTTFYRLLKRPASSEHQFL